MMFDFEKSVLQKMDELKKKNLFRELKNPQGIDFCSNDYLGLSESKDLKEKFQIQLAGLPMGSSGSRLLRGHSQYFSNLEKRLADFSGKESALYFPSGYQANIGLFSCLLKDNAVVFSDESIHASIIDGIRLSGCEKYIWSHNDLNDLEMLLKQKAQIDKLNVVVVESIYSMKGDLAPLKELLSICETYNAELIVDEAHATGLFGEKGSGRVEALGLQESVFATIHTAGKALGVGGAWVAGSTGLCELMVNQSRPFIYTTAPAFFQQAALNSTLDLLAETGVHLRERFFSQIKPFQESLLELGQEFDCEVGGIGGPVTSFVVRDNQRALLIMEKLTEKDFDVRAIRPPTVPAGEAQLRITLPLSRTIEEQTTFIECLKESLQETQ